MSNYFDNQNKWCWQVTDKEVLVITDHGTHTHTVEITDVPIGEMVDNTGQVMGDAHRAASHDFKEEIGVENTTIEENTSENNVAEAVETEPSIAEDGIEEDGEGCEDDLDI
jgi:hypothetical protein